MNVNAKDNAVRVPSRGFTDMTPLLETPDLLREQGESAGYLFFKSLLPKQEILELRRLILGVLEGRGLLAAGHPVMDGIADIPAVAALEVSGLGYGVPEDLYLEVQRLEPFHAIAQHPALLRVYSALFGEEAFPHPRNIARIVLPHPELKPTPPHQDFLHIQGSSDTWTGWFPLGDCPRELGGLAMLEGSHKSGIFGVTGHTGAGGLESILCNYDFEWAYDDYEAGDIVIFHSHLVHKAMPNLAGGGRIRLSCDFRYQPASAVIDPSSLRPHGVFTWEDVYRDWSADSPLRYYWTNKEWTLTEWDESIRWQKEKIC